MQSTVVEWIGQAGFDRSGVHRTEVARIGMPGGDWTAGQRNEEQRRACRRNEGIEQKWIAAPGATWIARGRKVVDCNAAPGVQTRTATSKGQQRIGQ